MNSTPFQDTAFTAAQPVNLREVLGKYIYHWPVFVLGLALAITVSFMYLRYTAPIYKVRASLLIKDNGKANQIGLKELDMFADTRVVENEMEILRSKTLMQEVVENLGLNISYKIKGRAIMTDIYDKKPVHITVLKKTPVDHSNSYRLDLLDYSSYELHDEQTGSIIRGKFGKIYKLPFGLCRIEKTPLLKAYFNTPVYLKVSDTESSAAALIKLLSLNLVNRLTTVIELSIQEKVIQRGKDVLDNLIRVYNEASVADKNRSTESSIRFIKERLAYISGELGEVEQSEENFRISHGIVDISSQAGNFQENVKANDEKLSEVDLQLSAVEGMIQYVNSTTQQSGVPSLSGINDPSVTAALIEYTSLQAKRERLLQTTQAEHPLVVAIESDVRKARENIRNSLNNLKNSLNRIRKLLISKNSGFEASIRNLPAEERQFINITRQKNIKENLYLILLQKLEEAGLSSATTLADNRILEKAYASPVPIKPEKSSIYLLSVVFGLFIPLAYVFSKDALNFKVISSKDITDRTSVPILGDVMYQEDADAIVLGNNSRNAIAEQFRSIRTNLQYIYGRDKGPRVTLFTSSMSGEGKSFISSNVAAALAMADRKTVILELDLRKPKISKYLNLKNKSGLSNYLIGNLGKEDIVQPSGVHPNLFVISSGPVPPNPAELLEQKGIDELIEWLKTQFDEVVIDTPPIGLVTDALILARVADASIYVIRHGVTLKSQVLAIEQLRNEKKFPKLNIIHNGIQLSGRYGYGYESNYGYGYGYGGGYNSYGYYDEAKPRKKKGLHLPLFILNFLKRF